MMKPARSRGQIVGLEPKSNQVRNNFGNYKITNDAATTYNIDTQFFGARNKQRREEKR